MSFNCRSASRHHCDAGSLPGRASSGTIVRRALQFILLVIAVLWVLVPRGHWDTAALAPHGLSVGMCPEEGIDYLQRVLR